MSDVEVAIESIGVRGDGIAYHAGERIYVPLTAPGDVVRARLGARRGEGRDAAVIELLAPGARARPACAHFGVCGGCALQHLSEIAYAEAKRAWLAAALRQHGVSAAMIHPLHRLAPRTRRRARWTMRRPRRLSVQIGFHLRASHQLVDLRECPVLHPQLSALMGPLRELGMELLAPDAGGAATATLADTGIDLLLDLPVVPRREALEAMAAFALAMDIARLSWRVAGEAPTLAAQRRPVRAVFGGIAVELPVDVFLQASADADGAIAEHILGELGSPQRVVADLFAGVGTFTFPLAARGTVHAVEGGGPLLAALRGAANRAGLAGRVTHEQRDLEAHPLAPEELLRFDAVVFDPPRAGAAAQSRMLAASAVPRIVAVSCNPATFARDARILADGGYRLASVRPIDSFVWSPHLELVARFERERG